MNDTYEIPSLLGPAPFRAALNFTARYPGRCPGLVSLAPLARCRLSLNCNMQMLADSNQFNGFTTQDTSKGGKANVEPHQVDRARYAPQSPADNPDCADDSAGHFHLHNPDLSSGIDGSIS